MSRDPSFCEPSLNNSSPKDAQVVGGHTPLLWETDGVYVVGIDGQTVADCGKSSTISPRAKRANAAFIVKAVNSHEANEAKIAAAVKALEECQTLLSDLTNPDVKATGPAIIASFANAVILLRKVDATLSSLKEGK